MSSKKTIRNKRLTKVFKVTSSAFLLGTMMVFGQATGASAHSNMETKQWHPIGSASISVRGIATSGRVSSIAISEDKDKSVIYLGSANGGVWSSNDNGQAWNPLTDDQASLSTGSIAVDPNNHNIIYDATGEQNFTLDSRYSRGILKSTDGGKNWTLLGQDIFTGAHIGDIVVDPHNSSVIWVAADTGLYKSEDGGKTWLYKWGDNGGGLNWGQPMKPWKLYIDSKSPGVIYMSVQDQGLYKSTDNGENFDELWGEDWNLPNWTVWVPGAYMFDASLSVTEGNLPNEDTIYTAYTDIYGNSLGMYVSRDSGDHFEELTNVPQYFDQNYSNSGQYDPNNVEGKGWYANTIAVDPTNKNHILAGGVTVVESYDGGKTWKTLELFKHPSIGLYPNQHTIVFDSEGNAYIGNDGGIFEKTKEGNWNNLNTNLRITELQPGVSALDGGQLALAGAKGIGTILMKADHNWNQVVPGDGGYTYIDPLNHNNMFAGTKLGSIFETADGGSRWHDSSPYTRYKDYDHSIHPGYKEDPTVSPLIVRHSMLQDSPGNYDILVGTNWLDKNLDGGRQYTVNSPYGTFPITAIAQSTKDPKVIYIGTSDGLLLASYNGGGTEIENWHQINPTANEGLDLKAQVTSISINPNNDKEITVTYGGNGYLSPNENTTHIFWTADTSETQPVWKNLSTDLPNVYAYTSIYLDNHVFVGTEQGIYMAKPGSGNWTKVGKGMPNAPVTSLVDAGKGKLVAGTYGRGAFSLELGSDFMQ